MSLIKKFWGSQNNDKNTAKTPPGLQPMGAQLQRRFAKGVQYNMKIVIKGDRNVGKTCLFLRLQGQKFKEEYIPTDEIQVASIQWNYKTTDDIVKVEVWDVVDKGRKKRNSDSLKLTNETADDKDEICLDAEFMDVYKGAHGVVMVYDITKHWTWSYVEREIEKVPTHMPVLILGNHRDMGDHRTVAMDTAKYFIEDHNRTHDISLVRYAESSMKNGFGLKFLHKFINLPFLKLQRDTLLKQLEINKIDTDSTIEEISLHEDSEEQNYDLFLNVHTNPKSPSTDTPAPVKSITDDKKVQSVAPSQVNGPTPNTPAIVKTPSASKLSPTDPHPTPIQPKIDNSVTLSPVVTSPTTAEPPVTPSDTKSGGFLSRIFKTKAKQSETTANPELAEAADTSPARVETLPVVKNVEDFVPDNEGLDNGFLDDTKETGKENHERKGTPDSDSDDEPGNPMVAQFQDDLDSDDAPAEPMTATYYVGSSDNDEADVVVTVVVSSDSDSDNRRSTRHRGGKNRDKTRNNSGAKFGKTDKIDIKRTEDVNSRNNKDDNTDTNLALSRDRVNGNIGMNEKLSTDKNSDSDSSVNSVDSTEKTRNSKLAKTVNCVENSRTHTGDNSRNTEKYSKNSKINNNGETLTENSQKQTEKCDYAEKSPRKVKTPNHLSISSSDEDNSMVVTKDIEEVDVEGEVTHDVSQDLPDLDMWLDKQEVVKKKSTSEGKSEKSESAERSKKKKKKSRDKEKVEDKEKSEKKHRKKNSDDSVKKNDEEKSERRKKKSEKSHDLDDKKELTHDLGDKKELNALEAFLGGGEGGGGEYETL